jgi:DNA-directed RNA polymerase sigma subunit (sigma70/sigma32)
VTAAIHGRPTRTTPWSCGPRLFAALDTLTAQQRAIVVLRYFDDRSEADVAQLLGVSTGTVKSTASRAVAQLRSHPGLTAIFATTDSPL